MPTEFQRAENTVHELINEIDAVEQESDQWEWVLLHEGSHVEEEQEQEERKNNLKAQLSDLKRLTRRAKAIEEKVLGSGVGKSKHIEDSSGEEGGEEEEEEEKKEEWDDEAEAGGEAGKAGEAKVKSLTSNSKAGDGSDMLLKESLVTTMEKFRKRSNEVQVAYVPVTKDDADDTDDNGGNDDNGRNDDNGGYDDNGRNDDNGGYDDNGGNDNNGEGGENSNEAGQVKEGLREGEEEDEDDDDGSSSIPRKRVEVPRYGPKMQEKVKKLLEEFDELSRRVQEEVQATLLPKLRKEIKNLRKKEVERRRLVEEERKQQEALELQHQREEEERMRREQAEKERREEEERERALMENARHIAKSEVAEETQEERAHRQAKKILKEEQQRIGELNYKKNVQELIDKIQRENPAALPMLASIVNNLAKHPENEMLRTLKLDNPYVQSNIRYSNAALELLFALGFRLEVAHRPKESVPFVVALVNHEPDPETDLDAWSAWFDTIQSVSQKLEPYLHQ